MGVIMDYSGRLATAMKFATDEGALLVDYFGKLKIINNSTENGHNRVKAILRDSPEKVIGFYLVTKNFTEKQVEEYIGEDLKYSGCV